MTTREPDPTLQLSGADMRALGYWVVDRIVAHFEGLRGAPVTPRADRPTLEQLVWESPPEEGQDPLAVLAQLDRDVLANVMHLDHPRFFAFVPGPSNFVSAMADALVAGLNIFAGTWLEASGPTEVELVTIDWLRQICGLPETAGGLFVSGGSMANLTALATARHVRLGDRIQDAVVYCSDQTHSSVERGLRLLGFQPEQVRKLPADGAYRLSVDDLQSAVVADREAGRRPFCVVANAGTTNTGAVDPLAEIAVVCREEGLWLHADGAYGAAAALCEKGLPALAGLEAADSVALDPHKWLFQPYEIGCVMVRDYRHLPETFRILPEYLKDVARAEEEVNFCDWGVQLTRTTRALKLWTSIKTFGLASFRQAVAKGFVAAELIERLVRALPDWEVVTPAQLGIVTFRYAPSGEPPDFVDGLNARLVDALIEDGYAMVSSTVLRGRRVLRMCPINPRTTEDDIRETLQRLNRLARGLR